MRRLIKTSAILLTCMALSIPQLDARGRNNSNGNNNNSHRTEQNKAPHNQQRPGNNSRPSRPTNNHNNNNRPNRPGNNNNNDNRRPGNNNFRPGNNNQGNNHSRPNHNWNDKRPQQPQWNTGHRPGNGPQHRPQHGHQQFRPCPPPPRPHMPAHRPWHRPTPPPHSWHPAPGWRPFNSILGVALGSAINFTINSLISSGYNVTGYVNDAVYVSDASMLNMIWPDATLYYGNNGLYASEFVYSTAGYNLNRYNSAYNALVRSYGSPYRSSRSGGVISSTWWGPGNQFITLTFQSGMAGNGSNRFFTTLSFGN